MSQHRIHAIDHLRAHMMLLGIVFHSAFAFSSPDLHPDFPYAAEETSGFFVTIISVIHLFRMPVFFLIAGFFTCLLISKRGLGSMLQDRAKRILIPLLLFWPVLYYTSETGFVFANSVANNSTFDMGVFTDTAFLAEHASLIHLWFLYMLIMFYVIFSIAVRLIGLSAFEKAAKYFWNKYAFIAIGVVAAPIFWTHADYQVPAPFEFIPDPTIYLFYFSFFTAGFLLYLNRKALDLIKQKTGQWFVWFLVFAVLHAVTGLLVFSEEAAKNLTSNWYSGVFKGISIGAVTLFVMSCYLRWANNFSKTALYISESSYWLYLIHFPLTVWIPPLMHDSVIPIEARFLITMGVIVGGGLITYELVVKRTFLVALLNGKTLKRKSAGNTQQAWKPVTSESTQ